MSNIHDEAIIFAKAHLSAARWRHTEGVVKWAGQLADIHAVDRAKTQLAALLHDVCKSASDAEIRSLIGESPLADEFLLAHPQLAHGLAAACLVERELNIKDRQILEAITFHTYGRPGMTDIEKIVYIADASEAGRHYPGVEELRQLARADLTEALRISIAQTIKELVERQRPIYFMTVNTWNDLIKRGE